MHRTKLSDTPFCDLQHAYEQGRLAARASFFTAYGDNHYHTPVYVFAWERGRRYGHLERMWIGKERRLIDGYEEAVT